MGFSMRLKGHDSWLDPESAGILGWKLGKRLAVRIAGREGRFITLTYNRAPYVDAQDCFDRARAEKHVSRFMRKLGNLLGVNLRGKWLCKLEFQRDGWVHWHIVLVDVGKIPKPVFMQLYDLWGRGSINVKPLTEANARYLMKYVAKNGDVPGWVYGYPARSVKVVRPSQGFWNDDQAKRAAQRTAARKARQVSSEKGNRASTISGEFFVPVGAKIRTERATIRNGSRRFTLTVPHRVLRKALRKYCGEARVVDGWRHYVSKPGALVKVLRYCEAASTAGGSKSRGAQPTRNLKYGTPLFLRGTGKRVGWWAMYWRGKWRYLSPKALTGRLSKWWAKHAPWWVKREWEQDGRAQFVDARLESALRRGQVYA